MEFNELLAAIEKSPGMYLGRPSITRLSAFIDGYLLGTSGEASLEGFQTWAAEKHRIKSAHKWSEIILFFEQEESDAFRRFFELFQEYAASKTGVEKIAPA